MLYYRGLKKQTLILMKKKPAFLIFLSSAALLGAGFWLYNSVLKGGATAALFKGKAPALNALEDFTPHRAHYKIELAGTKSGSQVVNITGDMVYEWYPACEGWITNHRFNITYEYADSPGFSMSSDFSNFEAFDGSRLDFAAQRKRDRVRFNEVRGQAVKTKDPQGSETGGAASFTLPQGLNFDLPEGTLFPMEHSLAVVEALRANKKFFNATIFDGSDEEGPVQVNSFIGKKVTPATEAGKDIDQKLLESPAHNIRLAFFPLKDTSSLSDYEMDVVFHDNSVISDMLIEYDDFTVRQKLIALEKLEDSCG